MTINKEAENNWYSFHFGSKFVKDNQPLPNYFGKSYENCYILFADLCNFTQFFAASDNLYDIEPLLQEYYNEARKIIHKNYGMLDKVLGDGFLIVWGIHITHTNIEKHILQCIQELTKVGMEISDKWQSIIDKSINECGMKFGLARGNIISIQRSESYPGIAILGTAINMASRLESIAKPNQLICSNKAFKNLFQYASSCSVKEQDVDIKGFGLVKSHTIDIECIILD